MKAYDFALMTTGVFAVAVTLACGCVKEGSSSPGALTFDPERLTFDSLVPGSQISSIVTLQCSGSSAVSIEGVSASCGCMTPKLEVGPIKPGESRAMRVDVSVPAVEEEFAHLLNIQTDFGAYSFEITGSAFWPIMITTPITRVENVVGKCRGTFDLVSRDGDFEISSVKTGSESLVVRCLRSSGGTAEFALDVLSEMDPDLKLDVLVGTSNRKMKEVVVPIKLYKRKQCTISPRSLLVNAIDPAKGGDVAFSVQNCASRVASVQLKDTTGAFHELDSLSIRKGGESDWKIGCQVPGRFFRETIQTFTIVVTLENGEILKLNACLLANLH